MSLSFNSLPNELLNLVFDRLPPMDQRTIGRVCRRFSQIIDQRGYVTKYCLGIWVDYERQVYMLAASNLGLVIYVNGTLPHNRTKNADKKSWLFEPGDDNEQYKIVRDVGNDWTERVGTYMNKMKHVLAESCLEEVHLRLAEDSTAPVPEGLLPLQETKIIRLYIKQHRKVVQKPLPEVLLPLVSRCEKKLDLDYIVDLKQFPGIQAKKLFCRISDEDAVELCKLHKNGAFPKVQGKWDLIVVGNVDRLHKEARRIFGAANLSDHKYYMKLPSIPQDTGDVFTVEVSYKYTNNTCDFGVYK